MHLNENNNPKETESADNTLSEKEIIPEEQQENGLPLDRQNDSQQPTLTEDSASEKEIPLGSTPNTEEESHSDGEVALEDEPIDEESVSKEPLPPQESDYPSEDDYSSDSPRLYGASSGKTPGKGPRRTAAVTVAAFLLIVVVIMAVIINGANGLKNSSSSGNASSNGSEPVNSDSNGHSSSENSSKPIKEPEHYPNSYDINGWVDKDDLNHEQPIVNVVNLCSPSIVTVTSDSGVGSGVIWTGNGYIVTNHHVVSNSKSVKVTLVNDCVYPAAVISSDEENDLALLRVSVSGLLPAAKRDADDAIRVGETAIVIGNPLGTLSHTVTKGIVSGLNRHIKIDGKQMTLMQIDASVNPGNSGGGCFDIYGKLIGIVNAKSVNESLEGLGYAIPLKTVTEVIEEMIENDQTELKKSIGIVGSFINEDSYREFEESSDTKTLLSLYEKALGKKAYGILVSNDFHVDYIDLNNTFSTGTGVLNGMQYTYTYDLIFEIDGTEISDPEELNTMLNEHNAGDVLTVKVMRASLIYQMNAFGQMFYAGSTEPKEVTVSIKVVEYYR